ncbi:DUF5753 domain-containing protein [Streptomyces inhibens]|uniref:DUF5753 domain-containing protein n=1 Tax=Streptomyces inhibens TaxID=2293571 RepID=UPI00378EA6F8
MYVEWKRLHHTGIRHFQQSVVPLYPRTRLFRVYCSNVIPGMLQTHGYAEALLSTISDFQGTPTTPPRPRPPAWTAAASSTKEDHRFVLLVEETVLRHRIGAPDMMAGQLGKLLELMSLPSVAFGVIPFTAPRTMWPLETFMVFDTDRAQVETLSAEINITRPSEIAVYTTAFTALQNLAVFGPKARARILAAIEALG